MNLKPKPPLRDISIETERHVMVARGTANVYQRRRHTILTPDGRL